jgi:hypothetical protein
MNNEDRAEAAWCGITAYCEAKEQTPELYDELNTVVQDLIVDLLHVVDLTKTDPATILRNARMNYEAEIEDEIEYDSHDD